MHGVEISPSKERVIAGGVSTCVVGLARLLSEAGEEVSVVTNDRAFRETGNRTLDFAPSWGTAYLIRVRGKYGGIRYSASYLSGSLRLIKRLREDGKIDVLHGHSGTLGLALTTGAAAKLAGIPAVHSLYSPIRCPSEVTPFHRLVLGNIKRFIVLSHNTLVSLANVGVPSTRIKIVPPYVDFAFFKRNAEGKALRRELGIEDDFVILFLGNLTKTKGIDTLVEALSLVKSKSPKFRLLSGIELSCTGTPRREEEIAARIRELDLSENLINLGLVRNMPQLMSAADVTVAPFRNTYGVADYPIAVLESMAVGTPVITTRVGGLPEIIDNKQNGILIEPADVNGLSNEILNLMNHPEERARLSENAASFVRNKFRANETLEKTRQAYKEALE